MSYGDFTTQIEGRGATAITRIRDAKITTFVFEGRIWECTDKNRAVMTRELADGLEMNYCLTEYCTMKPALPV